MFDYDEFEYGFLVGAFVTTLVAFASYGMWMLSQ